MYINRVLLLPLIIIARHNVDYSRKRHLNQNTRRDYSSTPVLITCKSPVRESFLTLLFFALGTVKSAKKGRQRRKKNILSTGVSQGLFYLVDKDVYFLVFLQEGGNALLSVQHGTVVASSNIPSNLLEREGS